MFKTLHQYLYLSYILPLLVVLPLIGAGVLLLLDSQIAGPLIENATNSAQVTVTTLTYFRYLVLGIFIGGMFLGAAISWVLVRELENLLKNVTRAVQRMVQDKHPQPLVEKGPLEFRVLLGSVNELAARLKNLEESRQKMLAGLLHELGRPIGAFQTTVYSLEHGASNDPELNHQLLAGLSAELHRFERLLDDLAHLNDQGIFEFEIIPQKVPLGQWLEETLSLWKETALAKSIHWRTDIHDNLPTTEFDPDRIGQALGNLLSNAIKFTRPYDAILVQAYWVIGGVVIRVSDTGPGIPAEEQEHIFEPFYQAHNNGESPKGLGLGLSIARDLVAAHYGTLRVESFPGLGSDFTIYLPVDGQLELKQKEVNIEKMN
jgi:two-component system sensor histidine kinase BaeS